METIFVREIEQWSGTRLLDILFQHTTTRFPVVGRVMARISHAVRVHFYFQLAGWCLRGVWLDPFKESWMERVTMDETDSSIAKTTSSK